MGLSASERLLRIVPKRGRGSHLHDHRKSSSAGSAAVNGGGEAATPPPRAVVRCALFGRQAAGQAELLAALVVSSHDASVKFKF